MFIFFNKWAQRTQWYKSGDNHNEKAIAKWNILYIFLSLPVLSYTVIMFTEHSHNEPPQYKSVALLHVLRKGKRIVRPIKPCCCHLFNSVLIDFSYMKADLSICYRDYARFRRGSISSPMAISGSGNDSDRQHRSTDSLVSQCASMLPAHQKVKHSKHEKK